MLFLYNSIPMVATAVSAVEKTIESICLLRTITGTLNAGEVTVKLNELVSSAPGDVERNTIAQLQKEIEEHLRLDPYYGTNFDQYDPYCYLLRSYGYNMEYSRQVFNTAKGLLLIPGDRENKLLVKWNFTAELLTHTLNLIADKAKQAMRKEGIAPASCYYQIIYGVVEGMNEYISTLNNMVDASIEDSKLKGLLFGIENVLWLAQDRLQFDQQCYFPNADLGTKVREALRTARDMLYVAAAIASIIKP